jgi:iron(III) transport system permease protein
VARELLTRVPDAKVTFVGTAAGLEARVIPREGFALEVIRSAGLKGKSIGALTRGLVLLPLGAIDGWFADAWREATGHGPGLLLTGTIVALVYAYQVRYFAVAWNGIEPGFARITPAMDAAARSLGAGTAETFRRVHAPLLRRSAAAALLLVFVDVMKELPATLVLRPFNFDTLATQAYAFARDERLAEAALPSLAIVAVGLIPIVALARTWRRRESSPVPAVALAGAGPVRTP